MTLDEIRRLSDPDMRAVNQLIQEQLHSDVALVNQLSFYIVNSGGKRIRPLLTVLAARSLGYEGEEHAALATVIEFVHTATLLHDDVVDDSKLRRGRETANSLFGNEASVLVGDFLYSRAFQMMVSLGNITIMNVLADATNIIAEGEVLQLMNCNDPDTDEARYMEVIYYKTAKLFEAATRLAATISGKDEEVQESMRLYGMHLGTAFQLVDDVLDYTAESETMGKNAGDDLAEGKPTLPLIHLLANCDDELRPVVRSIIENGDGLVHLEKIVDAMKQHQSLEYAMNRAEQEADKAIAMLDCVPDSEYKEALIALAKMSVNRSS